MNIDMNLEEVITELSMTYSFKLNLIVEGDDDRKFFKSAIRGSDHINFICAWGADNVKELVEKIDAQKHVGIKPTFGIIDRDYRIPLKKTSLSKNILLTDLRDLECMMINSPSFETVLVEFGSTQKIQKVGGVPKISSSAVSAASVIGELRYHFQNAGLNVSFQNLEIGRLLDRKTLALAPEHLVPHLSSRQRPSGPVIPKTAVASAKVDCANARCQVGNSYFSHPLLLCRGHDLMEILAIGFRSLFGSRSAAESTRENVESLFRLNYPVHFRRSLLATSINSWLSQHSFFPHIAVA